MTKAAGFNRELGLKIDREIWNGRQYDKIPEYFAEDLVSDRLISSGTGGIRFKRRSSAHTRRSKAFAKRSGRS